MLKGKLCSKQQEKTYIKGNIGKYKRKYTLEAKIAKLLLMQIEKVCIYLANVTLWCGVYSRVRHFVARKNSCISTASDSL